jgi:glutamine amidotransferase
MISIVHYGMGNIASVRNMFQKVGVKSQVITTTTEVKEANALVIPGVGHFDEAIRRIDEMGLRETLSEAALARRIPVIGICLGMQLMTRGSEEGKLPGFGWFSADTRLLTNMGRTVRVPHMGWNVVSQKKISPYFEDTADEQRFYFVHSYAVNCENPEDVLTTTPYSGEFTSAISRDNMLGVQFHPEKSHRFGAGLLRRFADAHGIVD